MECLATIADSAVIERDSLIDLFIDFVAATSFRLSSIRDLLSFGFVLSKGS